jgi:hypothetical protein
MAQIYGRWDAPRQKKKAAFKGGGLSHAAWFWQLGDTASRERGDESTLLEHNALET